VPACLPPLPPTKPPLPLTPPLPPHTHPISLPRPPPPPPPPRCSGSAAAGFASFLSLVASFDFANEPLLLAFEAPQAPDTPATVADRNAGAKAPGSAPSAAAAFASWASRALEAFASRANLSTPAADGTGATVAAAALTHRSQAPVASGVAIATSSAPSPANTTIWIATDREPNGALCCANGPGWGVLARLKALARAALVALDTTLLLPDAHALETALAALPADARSGVVAGADKRSTLAPPFKDAAAAAAAQTDRAIAALQTRVFEPCLPDFDVLLELRASKLPTAHLCWGGAAGAAAAATGRAPKKADFANLRHGQIGRGVNDEPVRDLVGLLRERYGGLALFCYDELGGRVIALKWRPAAFTPQLLKPGAAGSQHRMLYQPGDASAADEKKQYTVPNVVEVLAELVEVSGGLIKKVRLPTTSGLLEQLKDAVD
jgi:U3 small nucleolar RNA-associated protein 22